MDSLGKSRQKRPVTVDEALQHEAVR